MQHIVIIGGGPAGLSAGIYAARSNIKTTVLFKSGGALMKTDIENYFGFPESISGVELLARGRVQAERLGAHLVRTEAVGFSYADGLFTIQTLAGDYHADAVILAMGSPRKAPAIAGLREWEGRGVSYCAVCDAFFYRDKSVAVLGKGKYALEEAQTLLPVARSVTLLTNGSFPPNELPQELQVETRKITGLSGRQHVERVEFAEGDPLDVDGVFVAYGTAGSADFARKIGAYTKGNRICVDATMATNVPGLFAAGDCVGGLLQIAKAVSDGAQAALSAVQFVRRSANPSTSANQPVKQET